MSRPAEELEALREERERKARWRQQLLDAAEKYVAQGLDLGTVARLLGVSRSMVWKAMRERGVATPHRSRLPNGLP